MSTTATKPDGKRVDPEAIPVTLKQLNQWVVWRYVMRDGKWTKMPMRLSGRAASSTDRSTWTTFERALSGYQRQAPVCDGIGCVFSGDDGIVGVDLDDCINALDALSPMAMDLLDSVPGYAEVSPSGTGLKMWVRAAGMRRAFADKALGLEFYPAGRYFTVTGDARWEDHRDVHWEDSGLELSAWLERWLPDGSRRLNNGDDDELDLAALREPLDQWDLERVENELMSKLDPGCGYKAWLEIGMALHHQFDGAAEALDLWDTWSQGSDKYTEGLCDEKWDSFNEQRGGAVVTLRSVIKLTEEHAVATSVDRVARTIQKINEITTSAELEGPAAEKIAKANLSDLEREQLAKAIQKRIKVLDAVSVPIDKIRGWLKPRRTWQPFPDVNADGGPLGTWTNVLEVINRMGATVRYNVVSKEDEILIPKAEFSIDNVANAALARVVSECAKFEIPLGHVKNYVTLIADMNQYSPVIEWITSSEWDGVDRLSMLMDTVKVKPCNVELRNMVLKRWMVGAVAIAHNTGNTMARGILTFQGLQYQGKTRWLMSLAPHDHTLVRTGHTLDVRRVDSIKQAVSCWILELGELGATFKRSDIDGFKAFASQATDVFRKPYAYTEGTYPRRTALAASVNDQEFLYDPTGNTRFWVLSLLDIDPDHNLDMQQVWAQVYKLWQSGERHYMDDAEMAMLNQSNFAFTAPDRLDELISARFDWSPEALSKGTWMTVSEALQLIGESKPGRLDLTTAGRSFRKHNGDATRPMPGSPSNRQLLIPRVKGSDEWDEEDKDPVL